MTKMYVESADLTAVANAIRTKGGTSSPLTFPADFTQAIADISGGELKDCCYLFFANARKNEFANTLSLVKKPEKIDNLFHESNYSGAVDLSSVDGSDLTTMEYICYYASAITSFAFPRNLEKITSISQAFFNSTALTELVFPAGFACNNSTHTFPSCQYFIDGSGIQTLDLSELPVINQSKASGVKVNSSLKKIACPSKNPYDESIGYIPYIYSNTSIEEIVVPGNMVLTMYGSWGSSTKFVQGTGFIYVPDALVNDYKTATGWSAVASQIKGFSEHPAPWWSTYSAA